MYPVFISKLLARLLDIHHDKADDETIIRSVRSGVEMRGTNLFVLVFAILVASLGLNVNSSAVIIGAMLMSPLMGPIMGIGLGLGRSDIPMLRAGYRSLAVMVGVSIATSTLFFFLSPLREAGSELIARTSPTIYDVLIALFGGMAGILGATRAEKGNVIPGVAIATALMPPLCTAGYGLANGNLTFFAGALYLFFINGVMIATSAYVFVRILGLSRVHSSDPGIERRTRRLIGILVAATTIPSIYLGYTIVEESLLRQRVREFITQELVFPSADVLSHTIRSSGDSAEVDIFLLGENIPSAQLDSAVRRRGAYGLGMVRLRILQGAVPATGVTSNAVRGEHGEAILRHSIAKIDLMRQELDSLKAHAAVFRFPDGAQLAREIVIVQPKIRSATFLRAPSYAADGVTMTDTTSHVVLRLHTPLSRREMQQLRSWLRVHTGLADLQVRIER